MPVTPDEAFVALKKAVASGKPQALFAMLDQQTKWSVMSTRRAQMKVRRLVKRHYPQARAARELARTELAGRARDPAEYFLAVARSEGLIASLGAVGRIEKREVADGTASLHSGKVSLRFCREEAAWRYCGARETFERLKVRASRDLEIVQEGVDRGQGGS